MSTQKVSFLREKYSTCELAKKMLSLAQMMSAFLEGNLSFVTCLIEKWCYLKKWVSFEKSTEHLAHKKMLWWVKLATSFVEGNLSFIDFPTKMCFWKKCYHTKWVSFEKSTDHWAYQKNVMVG